MANRDLTQGSILRALTAVSAPMSLGILGVLSVGLADAYFLGQYGSDSLAAVGYIYPVTVAITSLSIGISAGANAAISQAIGKKHDEEAPARLALHATGLGAVLATLVSVLLWIGSGTIFSLMGAGDASLTEAQSYIPWWALSFPFLVVMMVINAAFRAHGNGFAAATLMIVAAVINIAINPVLIFGWGPIPEMGTEGASLATLVGRAVAFVAALVWGWKAGVFDLCEAPLVRLWYSIRTILGVGLPAALSNAINPAGMALVTAAVATLGDQAVAGFGAATRIQSVSIVVLLALSAGIGPVIGQNWGADKQDRARRAMRMTWMICLGYGLMAATVLTVFAEPIAAAFAADAEARAVTEQYLRFVSWSFFGYGVLVTTNAAMNARSKPIYSMSLSLARILLVYVPLAWIGVTLFGLAGILMAAISANVLAAMASVLCARATGVAGARVAGLRVPEPLPQAG